MKNSILYAAMLMCAVCFASVAKAQKAAGGVYVFGVAFSSADSTAYITDVQHIDGITAEKKTGRLAYSSDFSRQLADYLTLQGKASYPVTAVFYHNDRKKIERTFVKVRRRYTKDADAHTAPVSKEEFSFVIPQNQ